MKCYECKEPATTVTVLNWAMWPVCAQHDPGIGHAVRHLREQLANETIRQHDDYVPVDAYMAYLDDVMEQFVKAIPLYKGEPVELDPDWMR